MTIFKNLSEVNIHFSKVLGTRLYNEQGKMVGRLKDIFVDYEEVYPLVLALQYKKNRQLFYVPWSDIKEFSLKKIIIKENARIGRSRTYPKVCTKKTVTSLLASQFTGKTLEYPPIGRVVLDRQIVDTHGKKVVRVNDIQFIKVGPFLRVTSAEIGLRSLIRRLGFEPIIDNILKTTFPKSKYLSGDVLINWKYVHTIPDRTVQKNLKLNLSNEDIKSLHPADLADILEDIDGPGRGLIFNELDPELAAKTLSEIDPDMQAMFLKNEPPENAAKIIEHMGTDEAADILNDFNQETANAIISKIDDNEAQEEIQELLRYEENVAGGLMSSEVFEVHPEHRRSQIITMIQEKFDDFESIYDLYIIDNVGKLIGTCSLAKILIHKEDIQVGEVMTTHDIKSLAPNTSWKDVASYMSKYNLINVPIVDEKKELLGIVSVDDILPWLLDER